MWVTGVYRVPPQGRTFVPGYWHAIRTRVWRWVAGFWASSSRKMSLHASTPRGPGRERPIDAGARRQFRPISPVCGSIANGRFCLRPVSGRHSRSAGSGSRRNISGPRVVILMIDGYWDYPMEERGLVFAPVYFHQPLWQNAGWVYRPSLSSTSRRSSIHASSAAAFLFRRLLRLHVCGPRLPPVVCRQGDVTIRFQPSRQASPSWESKLDCRRGAYLCRRRQRPIGRSPAVAGVASTQWSRPWWWHNVVYPLREHGSGHHTRLGALIAGTNRPAKSPVQQTGEVGQQCRHLDVLRTAARAPETRRERRRRRGESPSHSHLVPSKAGSRQVLTFPDRARSQTSETIPAVPSIRPDTNHGQTYSKPQVITPPAIRNTVPPTIQNTTPPAIDTAPPMIQNTTPPAVRNSVPPAIYNSAARRCAMPRRRPCAMSPPPPTSRPPAPRTYTPPAPSRATPAPAAPRPACCHA